MDLLQYVVTMRHDRGTIDVRMAASSPESAAELVCAAEGAPSRSAVACRRWVAVRWSQDLTLPDGSDSTPDGDGCEPGDGAERQGGWFNPWDIWSVSEDFHEDSHQEEMDPEDLHEMTPAEWLAKRMNCELEGWPEEHFNEMSPTVYSGERYEHPYDGRTRTPAAHPIGFTTDEIREAIRLVRTRQAR